MGEDASCLVAFARRLLARLVIVWWRVGSCRFLDRDGRGQFAFNRLLPPWPVGYWIGDVRLHGAVPPGWLGSWEPRYRNCGNRQSGERLVVIPESIWGPPHFARPSVPGPSRVGRVSHGQGGWWRVGPVEKERPPGQGWAGTGWALLCGWCCGVVRVKRCRSRWPRGRRGRSSWCGRTDRGAGPLARRYGRRSNRVGPG